MTVMAHMESVELSRAEFDALLDYSASIPTGTTIGKKWKRRNDYYDESKGWVMGEYFDIGEKDSVGIRWFNIVLDSDMPLLWDGD
jgi:hypothetical protein